MRTSTVLGVLSLVLSVAANQVPLSSNQPGSTSQKVAKKASFLHITDFHPDPHYKAGATFESGCHRKPGKDEDKKKDKGKEKDGKGKGKAVADGDDDEEEEFSNERVLRGSNDLAGRWGSGVSDCDSPMSLINMTFDWLKKEWADEVDFVVWTGDNARHDIDRSLPRTPREIFNSNRMMMDKMKETFPPEVVIIPSIGNNDIYPHNVLAAGPNSITSEFLRIWKRLIPDDFGHVFERGAYFSTEVLPDRLAVISLNTLFWYDANTLVDGCKDRSNDPGALEMDWLEVQLQEFRDRGMQVWLTGHVPPHMGIYYDNCYLRYGDLSLRFQDTILGHLYGHMNIDHFFFVDVAELEATSVSDSKRNLRFLPHSSLHTVADDVNTTFFGPPLRHGISLESSSRMQILGRNGNKGLIDSLKKDFGGMPGPAKLKLKDYVVINVPPSVIPTYLPGIRVFSYNITGVSHDPDDGGQPFSGYVPETTAPHDDLDDDIEDGTTGSISEWDELEDLKKKRKSHKHGKKPKDDCKLPENEDKPHCTFRRKPRYFSKNSPSRRNQPLSPLGYAQFYLPDVDSRQKAPPDWKLEYTTYKVKELVRSLGNDSVREQPLPIPLHLLPGYDSNLFTAQELADLVNQADSQAGVYEGLSPGHEADDSKGESRAERRDAMIWQLKKMTPWKMKDLTIPSYVRLARKLVVEKKLWNHFSEIMFVSSNSN